MPPRHHAQRPACLGHARGGELIEAMSAGGTCDGGALLGPRALRVASQVVRTLRATSRGGIKDERETSKVEDKGREKDSMAYERK